MAKKPFALALIVCLFWNIAPPARATIFTGTCAVALDFEFSAPIRSVTSATAPQPKAAASYEVSIFGLTDLNPLTGGVEACVVDNTPTNPFKRTFGSASGNAIAWNCEETLGSGTWQQDWDPDPGAVFGAHTIAGTWGNWVMVVNNDSLSFTGTMHLTVAPEHATKLAECETNGMTHLSMVGIMHFQDPPTSTG
jgi:hypothetical protein